jgi:hypothetical protein
MDSEYVLRISLVSLLEHRRGEAVAMTFFDIWKEPKLCSISWMLRALMAEIRWMIFGFSLMSLLPMGMGACYNGKHWLWRTKST